MEANGKTRAPDVTKHMVMLSSSAPESTARFLRVRRPALKRRGPDGQENPELFFLSYTPDAPDCCWILSVVLR